MATEITLQKQEIIDQLAAGPFQALERMEAVAATTTHQHIRVRLLARQRGPIHLTLKVSLGINGSKFSPCLKSQANDQS